MRKKHSVLLHMLETKRHGLVSLQDLIQVIFIQIGQGLGKSRQPGNWVGLCPSPKKEDPGSIVETVGFFRLPRDSCDGPVPLVPGISLLRNFPS